MKTLVSAVAFTIALASLAAASTVTTLVGTGVAGFSDTQINNPYGMAIGPDGGLYFCDRGNQRIRRIDLITKKMTTIAGTGERGYTGDGGPATQAALSEPHEIAFDRAGDLYIAERDNHVIRKVTMKTGIISTVAGTGQAGFSGDGALGIHAQLRQPQGIFIDRDGTLLICDVGNHRLRRLHLNTGIIETWAGTGVMAPTPDGSPVLGTPVNGPRSLAMSPRGDLYLALREGNVILRIDPFTKAYTRIAGTGETGFSGDGGSATSAKFGGSATGSGARLAGPKGLAYGPGDSLYIADTDSHVIRKIDLKAGTISTVLGTGQIGDEPETDPLHYKLIRPHGVLVADGVLYVADSEAHRILVLK
jgi:DNA-binding beta-propeller fold protein YncE